MFLNWLFVMLVAHPSCQHELNRIPLNGASQREDRGMGTADKELSTLGDLDTLGIKRSDWKKGEKVHKSDQQGGETR